MAEQVIYKNVGFGDESTYGTAVGATATRLQLTEFQLDQNPGKEKVEDTQSTARGRDRMVKLKTELSGSMAGFLSPKNFHHAAELAMGKAGITASGGSSAVNISYYQNAGEAWLSKTANKDYNNSQERYSGVAAQNIEISASDNLVEFSAGIIGKGASTGVALPDGVGETIDPFAFADVTMTLWAGASVNGSGINIKPEEWSVNYENGLEASYFNSRTIDRVDPKIPMVSGSFKIFHEGTTFVHGTYGASEWYLRIDLNLPQEGGLIAGVTPHFARIDIPRIELTSNVKPYAQNEFAVEEIEFEGLYNYGVSALILMSQFVGMDYV